MKMLKNIFDGAEKSQTRRDINKTVENYKNIIERADSLLPKQEKNDELTIMIVNIIICFNSITNELNAEKVKDWLENFRVRLIQATKKEKKG